MFCPTSSQVVNFILTSIILKLQVTVSVKVLQVEQDTVVDVRGTLMAKQDILLADATATIKLILWDNLVNTLEAQKSYKIQHLSTRFFNNEKFLTSTKDTTTEEIETLQNVVAAPGKKENQKITGRVTQVGISSNVTCGNCRKKAKLEPSTVIFRCGFCSMKQKISHTITTLYGNINLKAGDKAEKLTIFHAQLTRFLIANNLEDMKEDTWRLEEYFLNKESVTVFYDEDKVIQSIEIS